MTIHTVIRSVLSVAYLVASVSKLRELPRFRLSAKGLGIPSALTGSVATSIPILEMLLSLLIATGWKRRFTGYSSAVLLSIFSVLLSANIIKGRNVSCGCFGTASERQISWRDVARNVAMILSSLDHAETRRVSAEIMRLRANVRSSSGTAIHFMTLYALSSSLLVLAFAILRRYGRALTERTQLEEHLANLARTEDIAVPLLSGALLRLNCESARNRSVRMLFVSSTCDHCMTLLTTILNAEEELLDVWFVVDSAEHPQLLAMIDKFSSGRIVVDHNDYLAKLLDVKASPTLVEYECFVRPNITEVIGNDLVLSRLDR